MIWVRMVAQLLIEGFAIHYSILLVRHTSLSEHLQIYLERIGAFDNVGKNAQGRNRSWRYQIISESPEKK